MKGSMASVLCKSVVTAALLFPASNIFSAASLSAKVVKGTVVSGTDNEPLIGATIKIDGKQVAAVTDIDGNFVIDAEDGQTIVISYLGFVDQKVKVSGSQLNVTMKEDATNLNDVVVIGYGVQKKKLVTGATVQVKGEDLARRNTGNALQAMQGQTPGVNIISESGQPGTGMKVIIRGQGSNTNNKPLYVIDGIPGADIATVNPSDIESIDVLKDAASAAIYGAQAANGVVIVTTRSGKEGNAKVTFDGYYGWQSVAKKVKMLNAEQYMTLMDEQGKNSDPAFTGYNWTSYKSIYDANGNVNNTNWMDHMFKNGAPVQNYTLGVTGGSKTSTYSVSLGYYSQEGILGGKKASNYERYNFRTNLEQKLYGDLLKVGENVAFSYVKNKDGISGNMYTNKLRGAFATSPLQSLYLQPDGRADRNDGYSYSTETDWYSEDGNPVANLYRGNNETDAQNWVANFYAELQPIKNL